MSRIAVFCIPAHGHTNPAAALCSLLVQAGHEVTFYSFDPFQKKIETSGSKFVSLSSFLPVLSSKQETRIKQSNSVTMMLEDLEITKALDGFLAIEMYQNRPDLIISDSVCFWGKLTAQKYQIPLVVSTTTFGWNQQSSRYLKNSPREMLTLMSGMPRLSRALKGMKEYGYYIDNFLELIRDKDETPTIIYTWKSFQPAGDSFSKNTCFVGPALSADVLIAARKEGAKLKTEFGDPAKPFIYISLGTVVSNHPDFYRNCIEALKEKYRLIVSAGFAYEEIKNLASENVRIESSVNQLSVLAAADLFISHCGMNSVSESLVLGVPILCAPVTSEQKTVAGRVLASKSGLLLDKKYTVKNIATLCSAILEDSEFKNNAISFSLISNELFESAVQFVERQISSR